MSWDAVNLSEAWKKFEQHARLVFAGPLSDKEEEVQCKYLLLWVGDRGREIYNTWNLSAENQKVLNTFCTKFTEHVLIRCSQDINSTAGVKPLMRG